jgi:hypothetical protein
MRKYSLTSIPVSMLVFLVLSLGLRAQQGPAPRDYYEIRVYHYNSDEQGRKLDSFLQFSLLPALGRAAMGKTGVFIPAGNDTLADKLRYVLLTGPGLQALLDLPGKLEADALFQQGSRAFRGAAYNNPPFQRMESILLKAFPLAPQLQLPALHSPNAERIYELRSYEGPTEELFKAKVRMFNEGGEIALFRRLNFNALFYATVLYGGRMPNLMYMTSFENKADRDAHWKTFGADPEWKSLSALPQYLNTVSRAEIILLHPAPYSEL